MQQVPVFTVNGNTLKVPSQRGGCKLPLAPVSGLADMMLLRRWNPTVDEAWRWLEAFPPVASGRCAVIASRHFGQDDWSAVESVFEPATPGPTIPAYKIAKSDGIWARLILDARAPNEETVGTISEPMPPLPAWRQLGGSHGWQADAKNWFYQLGIPLAARSHYKVKWISRRGQYRFVQPTRAPMGASWAPGFAQRCARALTMETQRRLQQNGIHVGSGSRTHNVHRGMQRSTGGVENDF